MSVNEPPEVRLTSKLESGDETKIPSVIFEPETVKLASLETEPYVAETKFGVVNKDPVIKAPALTVIVPEI